MTPRAHTSPVLALAIGASIALTSGAVADRPPAEQVRRIEVPATLLRQLDSASVQERIDATERLRDIAEMRIEVYDAVLSRPGLSLEAAERVSGIGFQAFRASPRGAMGVSFGGLQMPGEGVSISGTVAGFDASRVLQAGDVIRSIDGSPIREQLDARRTIISYDPDQTVTVEVLRAGELREFRVRLGAFNDLQARGGGVDLSTLRLAWETRVRRLRGGSALTPLDTGLSPDRLLSLRSREIGDRIQRGPLILEEQVVTGGERSDIGAADGPNITAGGSGRRTTPESTRLFTLDPSKDTGWNQQATLTTDGDKWSWQARLQRAQLSDASLDPAARRRLEALLRQNTVQIRQYSQQRLETRRKMRLLGDDEPMPQ